MEARPTPPLLYGTKKPSTAYLLEIVHESAHILSDAIKSLNERGISVSIQPAPEGSEHLIQLVYTC